MIVFDADSIDIGIDVSVSVGAHFFPHYLVNQ